MVATGAAQGNNTMGTITTQIVNINVNNFNDRVSYSVKFADAFDGFRQNQDGEYVETTIDTIVFTRAQLIRLIIDALPKVGSIYAYYKEQAVLSGQPNKFGVVHIMSILENADIDLVRTKFEESDEYVDIDGSLNTHQYAGYTTAFANVKLADSGNQFLNMAYMKILGL